MKRKLDDVARKLEMLYDGVRENKVKFLTNSYKKIINLKQKIGLLIFSWLIFSCPPKPYPVFIKLQTQFSRVIIKLVSRCTRNWFPDQTSLQSPVLCPVLKS